MTMAIELSQRQLEQLAEMVTTRLASVTTVDGRVHTPTLTQAGRAPGEKDTGMVDAITIAHELGVSRAWVYRNAAVLGGCRLGDGSRGRLRFDVERARAATSRLAVEPSQPANPSPRAESRVSVAGRRPRSPNPSPNPGSVLAVRPRAAA